MIKFYKAMFMFNGSGPMCVIYGHGLPSACLWMIPGTHTDD